MEYLLIILVNFVVYYRSLKYGLCVDDIRNRNIGRKIKRFPMRIAEWLNGIRPVKNIYFDHCLTLAIHTTVCLLMQVAFNCLPATLLFAVHIGNTHVSIWMNGKRYGVAACLCLVSYIYAPLGAIALLLLPYFQPSGILMPFVLALKGYYLPLIMFPLIFLVGNRLIKAWAKQREEVCSNKWFLIWTPGKICYMFKTYAFYFFRALVPMPPVMYISYNKMAGLSKEANHEACKFDLATLAGILIVFGIPILYLVNNQVFFGAMWWLILISIWNNWKTYTVGFAERYMYLPNIGLLVSLCLFLGQFNPYAWMVLFGIHIGMLIAYIPMYKDLKSYLKHHTNVDPCNDVSWNFLCNLASDEKDAVKVLNLVETGLRYNQNSSMLWLHKAAVLCLLGHQEVALQCIEKVRSCSVDTYAELYKNKIDGLEEKIKNSIKERQNGGK